MNMKMAMVFGAVLTLNSFWTLNAARATDPAHGAPFEVVRFGDLDLNTPVGLNTLRARVRQAAYRVCYRLMPAGRGAAGMETVQCRATLVDAAFADLKNPARMANNLTRSLTLVASR